MPAQQISRQKVAFSDDEDALLMKYIATHNPLVRGRLGTKLYDRLVANEEGKWSFASRHTAQSWRERYKTNQRWFDANILRYQKKHGISADNSAVSPRAGKSSHTDLSRNSPPPVGWSGTKKRAREVDADDLSPDPGPAKKMRRENVTVQGSKTSGLPPRTVSPRVEPPNKGKLRAELSSSPYPEEDRDLPVTGPDDYNGALSGESDHGEESQSDGGEGNDSSSPFPPSSPIIKTRSNPSANLKHASKLGRVAVSTAPEEPTQPLASSSRQQHPTRSSVQAAPKASSSARNLTIAPLQLSQEPTPPHSSALDSPGSPLPREHTHTTNAPPQSETAHQPQRVAPLKQRRSYRIVQAEEEDIFCTTPIQSPPSSPPPRAHARDAPRLVEGPYRSAYPRAKASHRPAPRGRVPKDVEANGKEWPPRRGERDASMSSRERSTATAADMDRDRASVQHIDLRVLHSRKSIEGSRASSNASFGSTSRASRTLKKKRSQQARAPKSSTPPNLSEANKELVLALGLEEVYKRMADNHKFHVDIVRQVAARQRSLEQTDQVLRSMREAAENEYERLLEREFGAHQSEESDEEEEEDEVAENLGNNEEHGRTTPPQLASPRSNHSQPELSMTNGGGYMEDDVDAMELDEPEAPANQADSSLPGSPALPNVKWTDDDDELLLDGGLAAHEELVRRKGLTSVKFRTAHLYSLLLDG